MLTAPQLRSLRTNDTCGRVMSCATTVDDLNQALQITLRKQETAMLMCEKRYVISTLRVHCARTQRLLHILI